LFKELVERDVTCLKMSRTILSRKLRVACSFLVDNLIIDAGAPYFKKQLKSYYTNKPPQQAVFTHSHEDHAGNVDMLNMLNIIPYVHENALAYFSAPPPIPYYRRFVWGTPAAGRCQKIGDILKTDKYAFQIIPTPGHSTDHICLYEEKMGWLFTGDLYVGERVIYLYQNEDLFSIKESLRKLSELNFSSIFCSHRGPVAEGRDSLKRKLDHIESLQENANRMKNNGADLKKITTALLGKEDYMYVISRGEFSKTAFVKALLNTD